MATKISKLAQIAGLLVCLAGIVAFLVGIFNQDEKVIEHGRWAISFGVFVLLGGTASRALATATVATALEMANEGHDDETPDSSEASSKKN